MYICVQALLSHDLIPSLVKDSRKVERLVDWNNAQSKTLKVQEERERSSFCDPGLDDDDDDDDDSPTSCSIEVPTTPNSQESMERDIADDDDDDEGEDEEAPDGLLHARGGVIKVTKTPWAEEDVRFLIELRAMGMTHSQTAVRIVLCDSYLGRFRPSWNTLLRPPPPTLPHLQSLPSLYSCIHTACR